MAVKPERMQIGTNPVIVLGPAHDRGDAKAGKGATIKNRSNVSMDLGDSTVATNQGYELDPGGELYVELEAGESLYVIAPSAGPHRLDVLRVGIGG